MKSICIIPARGGSKRIPRKNIKLFRGKPLINWVIDTAKDSECFDQIFVSTDDAEIASFSREFGAEVPFLRPSNLSDDYSNTMDVMRYMLDKLSKKYQSLDYICCIYATAPLLLKSDLVKSFEMIKKTKDDQILFGATSFDYPIQRAVRLDKDGNSSIIDKKFLFSRSQDLEEAFHDAGQFYWGTFNAWINTDNVLEGGKAFKIPRWRVQDIDVEEDWIRAEFLHKEICNRISE
ncbi:MAG: pseudaminic acid cytidylyltransferase [Prochlorococcus sp. SP3034]|nr:pseudaminic acid cytidylyltransferase [Prochlorococcus sp. SP3034]|tara:strand:+ start:7742 stop:8443 length:702 start_codon:yes stop_codon:yes gene_type:complete